MTVDYRAENLRRAEAVKAEKQEAQKDLRAYNLKRAQEVKEQKAPPASPSVPGESPRSRESPDRELSRKESELQRQQEAYKRGGDYGTYSRFYHKKYLPAYKRAEQWQKRRNEEARRQTVKEVRSQYPELTEEEMGRVEANIEYIQSLPESERETAWQEFMSPYQEIVTARRETYGPDYPRAGEVEPFWSKFKAGPVSTAPGAGHTKEISTGFVKALEPVGKFGAEVVTGRVSFLGGVPIQPVEREWKPTPLEVGGELLGSYALGAGAGRVVGGAFGFVAPHIARGAGAVGSKLGKLVPVGQKLGAVGAKIAKEPALVKMFVGGVYGGMELGKIKQMSEAKIEHRVADPELGRYSWHVEKYEPAFTPEEIGMEVGRDVATFAGFSRGIPKGTEGATRIRTWWETKGALKIQPEKIIEKAVRIGRQRFPTAPRGTTQVQLIKEFKRGRFVTKEMFKDLAPEHQALVRKYYVWHTTAHKFADVTTVAAGASEQGGMYVSSSVSPHFMRMMGYMPGKAKLFGFGLMKRPTAVQIGVTDITKAYGIKKPGAAAISKAFARRFKLEKEAILDPGMKLMKVPTKKAYSMWGGQRFVIDVYATAGKGVTAPLTTFAEISSRYASIRPLISFKELSSLAYLSRSGIHTSVSRGMSSSVAVSSLSSVSSLSKIPSSSFVSPPRPPRIPSYPRYSPSRVSLPSFPPYPPYPPPIPPYPPYYPTYAPRMSPSIPPIYPLVSRRRGRRRKRDEMFMFPFAKTYAERFFSMPSPLFALTPKKKKRRKK